MTDNITRLHLSNGLQVLLKEIHTAPLISHWIWYQVGSRDEVPGKTGISHWVEHMQFKGTPKFPAGVLDKAVSRLGGVWNAMTYKDWTTYFETLPAEAIDLALELEADRMVNSLFDPNDVASERTVIISERQGNENNPLFKLGEEVEAAAFRVHAYHHRVIGDLPDLQRLQREDLFQHYRAYYVPNNAVLAIAGDFETEEMIRRIKKWYEPLPSGEEPSHLVRPEPEQPGERRVTVEGPGETSFIQVVYHTPPAAHPDFLPLAVLDSLLTGPSSLNLFGSGLSNKTCRLYRTLVEKDLAVSVSGNLAATIDPYLYTLTITVHPQANPQEVVEALDAELTGVCTTPPSPRLVSRAIKQARALFAYGSESITNQAFWLGFSEMFADYDWFLTFLDRLAAVTPEDVLRVAQTYIRAQNRTLGIYHPTGNGEATA
jgi:zinc protease